MRLNTKAIVGFAALSLAVAEHHHHHHHRRGNDHAHANNLATSSLNLTGKTVTITDNTRTSPTSLPEIVVFVDKNGTPIATAEAIVVLVPPNNTASAAGLAAHQPSGTRTVSGLPAAPTGPGSPVNNATGSGLFGVAYAPYNADGSCKTASQIMKDFGVIGQTYGFVRVYGVDCNQIPNVYAAAKSNNLKVFFGIFSLDNLGDQIATLVQGIQKDWSIVDTVSIGNELVNNGQATPQQIINALKSGKALLQQSGWTGPVVTVDTFMAVLAHPELCQASDYCAVNIHPFFDPNTAPGQAGVFVANQVQNIRNKLGNPSARVRVTESGWPWQGSANGQAVPGVDQQAAALSSIRAAFSNNPHDMVLFSAFNDMWKAAAPPTFYAEQYWGIGTANAPSA
ncbi:cell wall glucanase [Diaporthe amygdali]|uniref:cell wall glucanase n=1 Tax=Phomopsis amygdali TaxID=1214568 RepID=UPI0022FDD80B|nr:cell wall glucanase [Diaporthe amygdali]KAJ0114383.1 cell wall glucanase [Diaporthe amygdali]